MDNPVIQYSTDNLQPAVIASLKKVKLARFRVTGRSMLPIISPGDWVIMETDLLPDKLKSGDIILISRPNDFVVHRIMRISENKVIAQGDWVTIEDPGVVFDDIHGKVIRIEKKIFTLNLNNKFVLLTSLCLSKFIHKTKKFLLKRGIYARN